MLVPFKSLGQAGFRIDFNGTVIYVDPYLSNSVELLDDQNQKRLLEISIKPSEIIDADYVLITHDHIDHCDPGTLPQIAESSQKAIFVGPISVINNLQSWGISSDRLLLAPEAETQVNKDLSFFAVPAAHPSITRDGFGNLQAVGYVLDFSGSKIYVAGDTGLDGEIIEILRAKGPIDTAILPINEQNFFRDRAGIIGNMSVREALQLAEEIGAKQFVPVHWDMFELNSVCLEELYAVHKRLAPDLELLVYPDFLNLGRSNISVVIRTLNEAKHLGSLLESIQKQQTPELSVEVVLVDSGSTDGTLEIADKYGCNILHITREEFSFGGSLNRGCQAASGEILVLVSGHCVPVDDKWLFNLCSPLIEGVASYSYGRQFGGDNSFFSEERIFAKYFPAESQIPQDGFFCNNANSALLKPVWRKYKFDETLTGLEDMELAQRLVKDEGKVAYVSSAGVFHHHEETWQQIRRRFEREAIALQKIMPQLQVGLWDTFRYFLTSIIKDWSFAAKNKVATNFFDICQYRWNQYLGSYKGNREHRKLTNFEKEKYFFPS